MATYKHINSFDYGGNVYEFDKSVVDAFPVSGATELTSGWLSETSGGTALTPEGNKIYVLAQASTNYGVNTLFRWNGSAYVQVSGGSSGDSDIFVVTPEVTTYSELFAAIQTGKYLCVHDYSDYDNSLYWVQYAEEDGNIYLNYVTANTCVEYKITSSNVWSRTFNYVILTENSTLSASKLSGAIPASVTATTQSSGDNSTKIATTAYVDGAINSLPEPMIFKGSLGTGGTITTLPAAASTNKGFTYKVITDGTYASQAAKVGDTFISDGTAWVLIPSGDEPSGTVTSIATGSGLSGGPITSSGTISLATAFGDTVNPYGSKIANYVLAAPNGEAGVPTFRALVAADLPNGNWLNGSATGSVRTSGSAVEDSSYIVGNYAVAEGYNTKASGGYSHAQNYFTEAEYDYQTVIGKYNDNKSTSAFEIGNGSSNSKRLNAFTVDWEGNIYTNNENIERDNPPSVNQWIDRIQLNDKNEEPIGFIRTPFKTNGDEGIQFETRRTINSEYVFNGFGMWIASDGTPLVTINQPAAWRKALGLGDPHPTTINLGSCVCTGMLSSAAGSLSFTIPTGRALGDGVSISKLTFNIVARASNSNGAGYYIIKATSGGSDAKAFNSTANFSFYNANNVSKTLTASQRSITLQGSTNIHVNFAGGDDFFSGTSTIRNYINNNACVVTLTNIVVELSYS